MNKAPRLSAKEIIAAPGKAGFGVARIKGSHHFLKHPDGRKAVVPVHSGETIGPGLLLKILRACEIDLEQQTASIAVALQAMKAFFFGAGCSYGTLQNHTACPTAKLFGDFLTRSNSWQHYRNLKKAANHLGYKGNQLSEVGLEELWSWIDHCAKFGHYRHGFLCEPSWLPDAICELKRALVRLCGAACEAAAKKIRRNTACTIMDLLEEVKPADVIVSFNWDTLVERLATKFKGTWTLIHCDGPPKRKQVRFAKPHGSVSWQVGSPGPVLLPCPPFLSSIKEANVMPKRSSTEPLLLGAVPMKSELLFEVQALYGACDVFQVIMNQWKVVVDAVREADVLTVVGYSFPREDEYGRFFFKEGMRQRNTSLNIEFYNRTPESGASILEVFGKKDTEVVWKGPVTAIP